MTATKTVLAIALCGLAATASAQGVGTAFTYQGRLSDGGAPANGSYGLQLSLWDAEILGSQIGPVVQLVATVTGGLFTVTVDFGAGAFSGDKRWLELWVRPAGGGGSTRLVARPELTPVADAL